MKKNTFDFGAELPEDFSDFKQWSTEGEMTALVDGDMLPYIVAFTTDERKAALAYQEASRIHGGIPDGSNRSSQEWLDALMKTEYFQEKLGYIHHTMNTWITNAKADSAKVFMTGDTNFRDDVAFSRPYKGQRSSEKPSFFWEFRTYLMTKYNAILSDYCEADDMMVMAQHRNTAEVVMNGVSIGSPTHQKFAGTVIVSKDKDLRICAGWNYDPHNNKITWSDWIGDLEPKTKLKLQANKITYNLYDGVAMDDDEAEALGLEPDTYARGKNAGKIKTKVVTEGKVEKECIVDLKGSGQMFFYAQIIMGDATDNYTGIKGCGATDAYETLFSLTTEEEMYQATLALYIARLSPNNEAIWVENYRGGRALLTPEQLMVEQGRLAWMQHFPHDQWKPEVILPLGNSTGDWDE